MAETQEWELQYLMDWLRLVDAGEPSTDDVSEHLLNALGYIDLCASCGGSLTEPGSALLALLEAEHFKRRIEAAGWQWCDGPYGVSGLDPVGIAPCGSLVWDEFPTLEAAAEYAEAHAQGVQE